MTRHDHPGAPARYDDGRGARFLALTKAWAAGIVVLLFTEYVQFTLVREQFAAEGGTESFTGRLLLIHLPDAVCVALSAWAAGRVHRPPFRYRTGPHLLAVLAVPLAAQALNLALQGGEPAAEGVLMSSAVLALGCVAGWAADLLQEGD